MPPTRGIKRKRLSSFTDAVEFQSEPTDENRPRLHFDIWYNICYLLRDDDRRHLYNLCLVSKDLNWIATPQLYHSIVLGPAIDMVREKYYPANLPAPAVQQPVIEGRVVVVGLPGQQAEFLGPATIGQPLAFQNPENLMRDGLPSPGLKTLLSRFRNDRTGYLRSMVHMLTILNFDRWNQLDQAITKFVYFGFLGHFISRLPSLSLVRMFCHIPSTRDRLPLFIKFSNLDREPRVSFTASLRGHPMKPELQLLGEGEEGKWSGPALPCITAMHVKLDRYYFRRFYNNIRLCRQPFHRLVFASPNLRSLSIEGPWPARDAATFDFDLFAPRAHVNFPPIEELSINGYYIVDYEWAMWGSRFPWINLLSLSVGPRPVPGFLSLIANRALFLRHFKMEAFADHQSSDCLCKFILSFNTLETLELVNVPCSITIIGMHHGLVKLCLHQDEPWRDERARQVVSAQDLERLDELCPLLEILELDMERQDGTWPREALSVLAMGFKNIRDLSLHFDMGVANLKEILLPVLNYESGQAIATVFFLGRWAAFDIGQPRQSTFPTKMKKLILWTGYTTRDKTDRSPRRAQFEAKHSAVFIAFPPRTLGSDPDFNHLQRWQLEAIQGPAAKKTKMYKDLKRRVDAAVMGPKPWINSASGDEQSSRLGSGDTSREATADATADATGDATGDERSDG